MLVSWRARRQQGGVHGGRGVDRHARPLLRPRRARSRVVVAASGLLVQEVDGDGVGRPAALQRSRVHGRRRRGPCRRGRARALRRPDRRPGGGDGMAGASRRRAGNHRRHRRALRARRARCPGADRSPRRPPALPRRARPRSQPAPRPGRGRPGDAGVRRCGRVGGAPPRPPPVRGAVRRGRSVARDHRRPQPRLPPARAHARAAARLVEGDAPTRHRPPERGVQDLGGGGSVRSRVDGRQHPPVDPRVRRGLRRGPVHAGVELAGRRPVRHLPPVDRRLPRGGEWARLQRSGPTCSTALRVRVYRLAAVV